MTKSSLNLLTALAVVCGFAAAVAADEPASVGVGPVFGEQAVMPRALQTIGPAPAALNLSCPTCPRLYDNTDICTVDAQSVSVGGASSPTPALWVRDWFTTAAGEVTGFDLFVVNCGPDATFNAIAPLQFFRDTDADSFGSPIGPPIDPVPAFFNTRSAPQLSPVPPYCDPETGEPRVMRVSVDYVARTYTIVDAETEEIIVGPQDIGLNRVPFRLPGGKIGADLRLNGEESLCAGGEPVAGPVLASGGSGNENGLHIINASQCIEEQWVLLCDNFEWQPLDPASTPQNPIPIPCVGGNACSLNRPFFGMAMVLYIGPNEDIGNGCNNERATASVVTMERPSAAEPPDSCSTTQAVISGYVGDNGCAYTGESVNFFDCDFDAPERLDAHDFACFQQCFGRRAPFVEQCELMDSDVNGVIDINDAFDFVICSTFDPNAPGCSGIIPDPPQLLRDVDLYRVRGLLGGDVLSVLVEGDKSPNSGPTWDPYLKIFAGTGGVLSELEVSDDYERLSFDAYTTAEVPSGATELFVGVSAAENKNYPTNDPTAIPLLPPDGAGGYNMTLVLTDPDCVVDEGGSECYEGRHEPDDSIAQADSLGSICDPVQGCPLQVIGMIGDGSFAGTGQDIDIYKIELTGDLANTRSLIAIVPEEISLGFPTEFDLVMALYDSSGELIATGDQQRRGQTGLDDSRPALGADVNGSGVGEGSDGTYYLAIFGTDRGLFDAGCGFIFPPIPPTLLNFPHGTRVAATNESDLRPTVGGRVNKPGAPLEGCAIPPAEPPRFQCYSLFILTDTFRLPSEAPVDLCDASPGDDSIPDACEFFPNDRLSEMVFRELNLGNGKYGLLQGDVDFYSFNAAPGDIIAANTSNVANLSNLERQTETVRAYLSLFDSSGFIFERHDYSLESADATAFDGISDEIAAAIGGEMPSGIGPTAFLMVGIDAGNMLRRENTPFDANFPGTTLSRRFLADVIEPREYRLGMAVMPKLPSLPGGERMFVVPKRGLDDFHVSCELGTNIDKSAICHPRILEINPVTGFTEQVIDGEPFFRPWRSAGEFAVAGPEVASSNLLVAWDGEFLWVAEEECQEPLFCENQIRNLFRVDPDVPRTSTNYINFVGQIRGFPSEAKFRGMTEINGRLYAMDDTLNEFRYWDKTLEPLATNGGTMTPTPSAEEDDPRWNDLYGDIGTDGTQIFVACTWNTIDPETQIVLDVGEYGICAFTPNPTTGEITFSGKIDDPITNTNFDPGPRLGGLELLAGGMITTSDLNSGIMQYWTGWSLSDPAALGTVQATELVREYQVVRISAR